MLLALCAAGTGYLTLLPLPVTPGTGSPGLCVICGARGVADFISNIILFLPFGAALYACGFSAKRAILSSLLFTTFIEIAQIDLVSGRDSSVGDILSNTAGGLIGWWLIRYREWWLPDEGSSRVRCLSLATVCLALLCVGTFLFTPHFRNRPLYLQWAAEPGGTEIFEGDVFQTRFGSITLDGPPGRIARSDAVRAALFRGPIDVSFTAGPPTAGVAPIMALYDDRQDQALLLGQDGTDLVFRYSMMSDLARLDRMLVRIRNVFEGITPGDTVRLTVDATTRLTCIQLNDARRCEPGLTAGDTWGLLQARDVRPGWRLFARTFWLWAGLLPVGFLAQRRATLASVAFMTVTVLLAIPPLIGFRLTPLFEIGAALLGLTTGFTAFIAVARHRLRRTGRVMSG
jgi:hypothetical protein